MYEKENLLLLMRHAKSDRSEEDLSDFERPLNYRGQQQPAIIAERLNEKKLAVNIALVSPAVRTRETWLLLESALNNPPKAIFEPNLYNAVVEDFIDVIKNHAEYCDQLLIIAHCPTIIEVAELLTGEYHDFKTANLAILRGKHNRLKDCIKHQKGFQLKKCSQPNSSHEIID